MSLRMLWLCLMLALSGCDRLPLTDLPGGGDLPFPDGGESLPDGSFAAPQGVAVANGLAFVANPNVGYVGQDLAFGRGFVTIIRLSDGVVLDRLPVSARNPQAVVAAGDRVVVLCSGVTSFDGTIVRPAGDGALVILDAVEAAAGRTALVREVPLPRSAEHPLVGYPSTLALLDGGTRAWLGSGTAPALFLVDLEAGTVLRGADAPVVLGDLDAQDSIVVRPGPDGTLLAGRFENDEVLVLDGNTGGPLAAYPAPFVVGDPAQADGVQDLAVRPDGHPDLFVLLGLASQVTAVDTAAGIAGVRNRFATTGPSPNRLVLDRDRLLVVNSGENNVTAFDVATGRALGKVAIFVPRTNPYDLAVYRDGNMTLAAVTGQGVDALFLVDLDTAQILKEVR